MKAAYSNDWENAIGCLSCWEVRVDDFEEDEHEERY